MAQGFGRGLMTVLTPRPAPNARAPHTPLPRVDPITNLPILILFPHSRCNCRCVMCDIWKGTTKAEIDVGDVARWTAAWRALGVRRVVLTGGEALMHSDLWALCDVLRSADISISVLTTGLLLARDATELAKRCDDVVVSLDGPREVHDAIRNVPRAFDRLAEGVRAVKAASGDVQVTGRCTVQRTNFHALRATVAAAHDIGLDRISFLAADVSSEAFNRPNGWDEERVGGVALDASQLLPLAAEIDALEREFTEDFDSGYIAEPAEKLRRRLSQYYSALRGFGDFAPNDCNAPWVSAVVESDGTVRPCFFQPALGNVNTDGPLEKILNSDGAVAWRMGLDTRRNAICRRCVCTLSLGAERP